MLFELKSLYFYIPYMYGRWISIQYLNVVLALHVAQESSDFLHG